jgi:hypothetical protein
MCFYKNRFKFMKNQKSTLFVASFMFFGLFACNTEQASEQTSTIENATSVPAPVDSNLNIPPLSAIPESSSLPTATIPPPTGLNPGGQLTSSSAPLNPNFNPAGPKTPTNAPLNTASATKSSVRLNPAHGQPGHDCAIAVGAPLKGSVAKVAAPAPVQATAPNFSVASVPDAAPVQATAPNFGVPNAKVNPAHGQPGHDCAVAVGAPLPVK